MSTPLQTLLIVPFFITIEFTRSILWAARTIEEPDRDGPLLRAIFALLISALGVVPTPVWTCIMYVGWLAWIPIRGVLWIWGIGRERVRKESPKPVRQWYAHTRERRAGLLQRQSKGVYD